MKYKSQIVFTYNARGKGATYFVARLDTNSFGEIPMAFLMTFEKYSGSENPDGRATFFTEPKEGAVIV